MKKQPALIRNTPEEEAAIERGIAADPDTFVPTDEQFAQMKRRGGRPKLAKPKEAVTVRLTPISSSDSGPAATDGRHV